MRFRLPRAHVILDRSMADNRDLRIAAIFVVLVAGALGVLPTIVKQLSEKTLNSTWFACAKVSSVVCVFCAVTCFISARALIHVLLRCSAGPSS